MSRRTNDSAFTPGPHTRVRRRKSRAIDSAAFVRETIDEALICHVAFTVHGHAWCLPMAHARSGDTLYLHGSTKNQMLRSLENRRCTVTFTLLDGLVFARSALHHSMNYRSVVALGTARHVDGSDEKRTALNALVERLAPGRSAECRAPSELELRATNVLAIDVEEASAKRRNGPAVDDDADHAHDSLWAGVLPVTVAALPPERDATLSWTNSVPSSVRSLATRMGSNPPLERCCGDLLLSSDPMRIDLDWVHQVLSRESYWAKGVSRDAVRVSLEHSVVFGAYQQSRQIGFARVVTDRARFGYLADVFVDKSQRRRGVGSRLIEFALAHPLVAACERLTLGTLDAPELYERFGFQINRTHHAMSRRRSPSAPA